MQQPFRLDVVVAGAVTILVGAVAIRFAARVEQPVPHSDALQYVAMASNALAGRGFRFAEPSAAEALRRLEHGEPSELPGRVLATYRAPLYPALLAVAFRAGGSEPRSAYVAQAFCQAVFAGGVYGLTRVALGPAGAAAVALATGLDITLLSRVGHLLPETLLNLLVVLAMLAFFAALTRPAGWSALAGSAWGAATLAKGVFLLVPLALAPFLWRDGHRLRWFVAGFLLTLAPWTIRNYAVTGRLIPVQSGQFWWTAWSAVHPLQSYSDQDPEVRAILAELFRANPDPAGPDLERAFRGRALAAIRAMPAAELAGKLGMRVLNFWMQRDLQWWTDVRAGGRYLTMEAITPWRGAYRRLNRAVAVLAVAGLIMALIKRDPRLLSICVMCAYGTGIYLLTPSEARYADPFRSLEYVLAGLAVSAMARRAAAALPEVADSPWSARRWLPAAGLALSLAGSLILVELALF